MDKKIQKYLETSGVKFTPIKHRKVYTAFNAAETQGVNMKEVVKTVLVKFDKAIAFLEESTSPNLSYIRRGTDPMGAPVIHRRSNFTAPLVQLSPGGWQTAFSTRAAKEPTGTRGAKTHNNYF